MSYMERFHRPSRKALTTAEERSLGIMFFIKSSLQFFRTELSISGQDTVVYQDDAETLTPQRGASLMVQQTGEQDAITCRMMYTVSAQRGRWHFCVDARWPDTEEGVRCHIGFTENGFRTDSDFVAITDEEGRIFTLVCRTEERQNRHGHVTVCVYVEEGF